jgi:hypothetical protein
MPASEEVLKRSRLSFFYSDDMFTALGDGDGDGD